MIVGCDEAGVGSLISDLIACAVNLPEDYDVSEIKDSKKLCENKRKKIADTLKSTVKFGIGVVSEKEIDLFGMARCRRLVFERALDNFENKYEKPCIALIDGTLFDGWKDIKFECHIKGDQKYPCISAASIIAKVKRDEKIIKISEDEQYSEYDWSSNKGYPTKKHKEAIRKYGLTKYHRQSYKCV